MLKMPALCGTAVLCLALLGASAQITSPTTAETFQPDMLPQSPEAEAMVKNTVMPVTLYSGMADVSVPVYDIKTRNLDVPISLSYNYNGFKPAEVASYVGLGWSVQGGGVISRIVKGRVDHQDPHVTGNDYDNYVNINLISVKQTVAQNMTLGLIDGEPDIYVFNAPGLSGKFIMMQGQPYMLPYQKIRVSGGQSSGFTLTNEKGDQYVFTTIETRHHHQLRGSDYVPDHASAYYLTRIVSADLTDTVTYAYTPYTYNVPPVYSELYTVNMPAGSSVTLSDQQILTETPFSGDWVQSQQLSSITYRGTTISFGTDGVARSDIFQNDGSVYSLGSISITSALPTVNHKSFTLQHQYVNGKLSLAEVDVQTPNPGDVGGVDPSTLQKYQFQYMAGNGAPSDGFGTHGIDYYGYYNGATSNVMLFTSADINNSTYAPANRAPAMAYSQANMLSRVTYPTGGYATFAYEQNQTGHYIVTGKYSNVTSTSTVTATWPGNDPTFTGTATASASFTINQDQFVQVSASYSSLGYTGTIATLSFYTLSGTLSGTIYFDGSQSSINSGVELAAGYYNYTLTVSKKGLSISPTVTYYNSEPVIDNTLGPAPGLRVKTISHYDNSNSNSPSLVKQYTYSNGVGFFRSGTAVGSVVQHGTQCTSVNGQQGTDVEVLTLQAGLFAPTSDLLNNQFYYQNVTETDIGPTNIGRTDYVFNCFAPDEPDVFLQQKTEYGYANGAYYPLHQTVSNYQLHDLYSFQTVTAHLTDELPSGGYQCAQIQTPDATQPAYLLPQIFGITHGDAIPCGYKSLQSTVETSWDMNGTNPMTSESDYYYDNPDYLYPTRIKRTNSKGQTETTYLKYALDYPVAPALRLHSLDSAFSSWENTCINNYNTCYDNLVTALQPYQPYYNNQTQFTNIANSYHCEQNYNDSTGTTFAARKTQLTAWINSLDSAEAADPVVWHKGVYWLQASNAYSPVIEEYSTVTKSDGNEYLVDAVRNDYSILTNSAGASVAKQTGFEKTQLTAPLLYSTFVANTDAYYSPQVAMSFNVELDLTSQHQTNNVNYNYLWGYNHRFPVAEVVGADAVTVAGLVNQSVLDNPPDDQTLRNELNKVRTGLAGTKALVTTCTYDPLTGMTSRTDAAGRTTFFEYDAMGRLMDVKDLNGNIIKTYQYHVVN